MSTRYDILAEFTPNGLLQYPDETLMADEIVRLRDRVDAVESDWQRTYDHDCKKLIQRAEAAEAERSKAQYLLDSVDCSAREGSGLLHCRHDAKCAVCSLRAEREALRAISNDLTRVNDGLHAKVVALTAHMNQVHEELGGTDTVLTLEAAQYVVAERDALRKDAAAISSTMKDAAWLLLHASRQGVNERLAMIEASCNLNEHIERIDAAMAVQPTTGEKA